jgi:hypothetical protein
VFIARPPYRHEPVAPVPQVNVSRQCMSAANQRERQGGFDAQLRPP